MNELKDITDFITGLGINSVILLSIVGITEFVKLSDKKNILKRIYIFIPLILSIIGSYLITVPFAWRDYGYNVFIYFGLSTLIYGIIKKAILKQSPNLVELLLKKIKNKKEDNNG